MAVTRKLSLVHYIFLILTGFIIIVVAGNYFTKEGGTLYIGNTLDTLIQHPRSRKIVNISTTKWIVVTSINSPTNDIKALAKIPGWQLLVVGDMKTPADWFYSGVIFLSVQEQLSLGYKILNLIPYNNYARKVIGYLYAIQNGATVIYETDDDNHPVDDMRSFLFNKSLILTEMHGNRRLMNPYAYFGQPTIWPRGYPLENISEVNTNLYHQCKTRRPSVQQGLVNGDPDVDAIFRLTRKNSKTDINVQFSDSTPPILLPVGTFSPYNSQNTVIHYEAFWSLLLSVTVTFRVTDIWRSYWAQRLMWLVSQQVVFLPPNAFQKRNAHSYLKDFIEEADLYAKSGLLVNFLSKWKCSSDVFVECIGQLSKAMADAGFWGKQDVELVALWLHDLQSIGYRFPTTTNAVPCRQHTEPYTFIPKEQKTIFQHTSNLLELVFSHSKPRSTQIF